MVFAGAGSHSGAFIPGDYVVSVDPVQVRAILKLLRKARRLLAPWRHYTGSAAGLGIPFVDYARGDGIAIGPEQDASWSPVVIGDDTPWVRDYQGLWGLDTRDRFGGERAPSGPRYERDGSVRVSWANPLGWAGLLKIPPQTDDAKPLSERIAALERELGDLNARIDTERTALRGLRAQVHSLGGHDYARALAKSREVELAEREAALNLVIASRTSLAEERRVHLDTLARPISAESPQAHIKKPHEPQPESQERRTRFLKVWAAVSTPLLLGSIIVLLIGSSLAASIEIAVLVSLFIGVEAVARRRFLSFLGSTILLLGTLALGGALVLLFLKHWRTAASVVVGVAALALLVGNLRDARRG